VLGARVPGFLAPALRGLSRVSTPPVAERAMLRNREPLFAPTQEARVPAVPALRSAAMKRGADRSLAMAIALLPRSSGPWRAGPAEAADEGLLQWSAPRAA